MTAKNPTRGRVGKSQKPRSCTSRVGGAAAAQPPGMTHPWPCILHPHCHGEKYPSFRCRRPASSGSSCFSPVALPSQRSPSPAFFFQGVAFFRLSPGPSPITPLARSSRKFSTESQYITTMYITLLRGTQRFNIRDWLFLQYFGLNGNVCSCLTASALIPNSLYSQLKMMKKLIGSPMCLTPETNLASFGAPCCSAR